jgi:hypothetical protein
MATHCKTCGGELRFLARFCATVCFRCSICAALWVQTVPPAVAAGLAPSRGQGAAMT